MASDDKLNCWPLHRVENNFFIEKLPVRPYLLCSKAVKPRHYSAYRLIFSRPIMVKWRNSRIILISVARGHKGGIVMNGSVLLSLMLTNEGLNPNVLLITFLTLALTFPVADHLLYRPLWTRDSLS